MVGRKTDQVYLPPSDDPVRSLGRCDGVAVGAGMKPRYYARSACYGDDDWPWWFVADKHRPGLNVTSEVATLLNRPRKFRGPTLCAREYAELLAEEANKL